MKISKKEAGNGPIFKEIRKKHLQSMIEVQRQEIQEREIDVTFRSKKRESVFERLSYTKEHRMKRNLHHSRCTERERERERQRTKKIKSSGNVFVILADYPRQLFLLIRMKTPEE